MEHIRQYDWCALQPDNQYFVTEEELDNCVTEQILRNRFCNPLMSSDSEDEGPRPKFDWDFILKKRDNEPSFHRIFVPGLRPPPGFSRLSTLTAQQHNQCLKVLCARNPGILEDEFLPRPTKLDLKVFEELKEVYLKEQQEYIEWAKTLWTNGQCIRALRPKPLIETVYEAEFKVRANQMKGYPKVFELVAQIPLDSAGEVEMVMQEEIIGVNTSELPKACYPNNIRSRLSVMRPCAMPEPCEKHPVRFVLPNERSVSVLPLGEVQRELARLAGARGARGAAGEAALRCLLARRAWALPVSVFSVPAPDGSSSNVIVLGSEFLNKQENVLTRTFRALKHLLEFALVPPAEMAKLGADTQAAAPGPAPRASDSGSDDDDNLFIDFDDNTQTTKDSHADIPSDHSSADDSEREMEIDETYDPGPRQKVTKHEPVEGVAEGFGVYRCTCQDTIFERPPPRSFRKWQFRNKTTFENFDVIVHCAHKFRGSSGEILIEPIPEYQADMGASKQSEDRITSLALALALRDDASVLNVRLDAQSGDVITLEELSREQFAARHAERARGAAAARTLLGALSQLQGLVPGHYVLQHEPSYGDNAMLYAPRNTGEGQQLRLLFDSSQPAEADEAKSVKIPPVITPALLPWHKFRKILPCAFTHYPSQLAKPKKIAARKKTPPRALKWPKKRRKAKKNTQ